MSGTVKVESVNLRLELQRELVRRCKINSSYSLRSFAKFLEIDPSRLSKILKGKRPISRELVQKFGEKLNLSFTTIEYLKGSGSKQKTQSDEISSINNKYYQISADVFSVISDWQHYAILELMKLDNFSSDPKWIAKKLSISVHEVQDAIERLIRVNLLVVDENGKWSDLSRGFSSHVLEGDQTTYAHLKHQEEILNMAVNKLKTVPVAIRDNSSIMMATGKDKIREAKRMILEFRRRLCEFLEDSDKKDTVMQLGIALFPIIADENLGGHK